MWNRLWKATLYSISGLKSAYKEEKAFRQEISILCLIIPAGLYLGKTGIEKSCLIGSWIMVLIVELINASLENIVDRIGLEKHELSGRAKDLGSAAVMCAIILAVMTWVNILFC
ncbi:MAG: diacylglycerol kinase [Chlamydiota bacterium]|nr:diacylglycerol kinase [Chlamydiota bacterium]